MYVGETAAGNLDLFWLEMHVLVYLAALAVETSSG
jgi:hypothetical protein